MKTFKIAFFALLFMMTGAVSAAVLPTITEGGLLSITDELSFEVPGNEFSVVSATRAELRVTFTIQDLLKDSIVGFGASILDTSNNVLATLYGNHANKSLILVLGDYKVAFFGTPGNGSIGANALITANAVPLPAAVWLFGSALMGLFGVSRRKSTAIAA